MATVRLTGCAVHSVVTPYPPKISPIVSQFSNGEPISCSALFAQELTGVDRALFAAERGRIRQMLGDSQGSSLDLGVAIEEAMTLDDGASISIKRLGISIASLALNDNVLAYRFPAYERILLHTYQALGLLNQSLIANAAPEIRRAMDIQARLLTEREKVVSEAISVTDKDAAAKSAVDELQAKYAGINELAGKVKNSFQNAFSFYLAGLILEMNGEAEASYKEYQNALELASDNSVLQRDVMRAAVLNGRTVELEEYKKRFPKQKSPTRASEAEIVVFFDENLVPERQEIVIPVPVSLRGTVTALAFPTYPKRKLLSKGLNVSVGTNKGKTEPLVDVSALAAHSLKEEFLLTILREILRAATKGYLGITAERLGNTIGSLVTSGYNIASAKADLRSWLLLPDTVQVYRSGIAPGSHKVSFYYPGNKRSEKVSINISAGQKAIVHVVAVGKRLQVNSSIVGSNQAAKTGGME